MVWTLAIFWLVYWFFRLSKGRDLGGARRLWMGRVISAVGAFVILVIHWLVVGSLVDALWPDLGYEGAAVILAEVAVILSGALIRGYLVPRGVYVRFGVRCSSALDATPDGRRRARVRIGRVQFAGGRH